MVHVVVGRGLPGEGDEHRVEARTLGEALDRLRSDVAWLDETDVRVFVGGRDAATLEGEDTPVGDEDTVLLTRT